ncbi:3718_t:CDS:2 [Paraglomus brasilianum]|uniref:3718_t:CDS:1 n=1 Tax=Paraglomus brasilianum TaxID=144538 RepID=A0A9N8VRU4_9GLOM|nr:3718_t:CDS:2 [Paraglomus brasilianum]
MATYKQKTHIIPARPPPSSDSEESSSEEWVVFNDNKSRNSAYRASTPATRATTIPLYNPTSSDDEWHVLSDSASPIDESNPTFDTFSDSNGGLSGFESEIDAAVHDESEFYTESSGAEDTVWSFHGQLPLHDGAGNFCDTIEEGREYGDGMDSNVEFDNGRNSSIVRETESDISNLEHGTLYSSATSTPHTASANADNRDGNNSTNIIQPRKRDSWKHLFKNVFKLEDAVKSNDNSQGENDRDDLEKVKFGGGWTNSAYTQTSLPDSINSSSALSHPATRHHETSSSIRDTTPESVNSRIFSSERPNDQSNSSGSRGTPERRNPIFNRFSDLRTLSRDSNIQNENAVDAGVGSENNFQKNQDDASSILSTVWSTVRRLTSSIITPESDIDFPNTGSFATHSSSSAASTYPLYPHYTASGLASIVSGTGENQYTYDGCYLPFGNHLTLSELGGLSRNDRDEMIRRTEGVRYGGGYGGYRGGARAPANTVVRSKKRSLVDRSETSTKRLLTPVSSSASLASFVSRSGSECGMESVGIRSTGIECGSWEQECM